MNDILQTLTVIVFVVFAIIISAMIVYLFIWWDRKQRLEIKKRRLAEYEEKKKVFENARNTYLKCLSELKKNPINPNLKQKTLYYGREFANVTRAIYQGNNTVTVFDEIALMND